MEMKKVVFLAAIIMAGSACGHQPHYMPALSPTPQTGYAVTATNTDHHVTMHVGDKLEVVLRAAQGMNNWSHPTSSDPSVLTSIVDPAATAAVGVTLAAFQAMKPGEVDVTSNGSPKCSPGQACPMYVALYELRVLVTR
jgi:hypothetical protein